MARSVKLWICETSDVIIDKTERESLLRATLSLVYPTRTRARSHARNSRVNVPVRESFKRPVPFPSGMAAWRAVLRVQLLGRRMKLNEAVTLNSNAMTSRNSRRKAPKNGTTGHSGIARERASANSYSADRRAEERFSKTGTGSFTLCQNGFNLLDLQRSVCISLENLLFQWLPRRGYFLVKFI